MKVPTGGFGKELDRCDIWLRENVGSGDFAVGPTQSIGYHATAFYFRHIEDAEAFLAVFHQFEVADTVERMRASGVP